MQSGSSLHGCRRVRVHLGRLCAGFTLVEVLVALFVVALGIAGAAGLQTLAVRAGRDATRLSDATRLARSLAERMHANPHALALPDAANPYLLLDYAAASGPPAAAALCYADTCDADALARFDLFEVSQAVASGFPDGRIRVCRDAAPLDAAGLPMWRCEAQEGAPLVVKLGWRAHADAATGVPKLIVPLAGAAP
jgi:type IV pilus assembly protein PilV